MSKLRLIITPTLWIPISSIYSEFIGYEISSTGLIRNCGNILKVRKNKKGYLYTNICSSGKRKTIKIHRIVALLFLNNPHNLPCVDHEDGNKLNNNRKNLRWCTRSQNSQNCKTPSTNTTGYKNISIRSVRNFKYWHIEVKKKGERHICRFPKVTSEVPEEVISCRDDMLKQIHGKYASRR